jgi:hypothetical protein
MGDEMPFEENHKSGRKTAGAPPTLNGLHPHYNIIVQNIGYENNILKL